MLYISSGIHPAIILNFDSAKVIQVERNTKYDLIDAIAVKSGFNSTRTFYRQFRNQYCLSPTNYRILKKKYGVHKKNCLFPKTRPCAAFRFLILKFIRQICFICVQKTTKPYEKASVSFIHSVGVLPCTCLKKVQNALTLLKPQISEMLRSDILRLSGLRIISTALLRRKVLIS